MTTGPTSDPVSTVGSMGSTTLLGRGIYSTREAARLIHAHPDLVARWTNKRKGKTALIGPSQGDLFSFHDLISLLVVKELWVRGVTTDQIRAGRDFLAVHLQIERPFAHHDGLATVGRSFFADLDGGWYDAGKGGQGAFQSVIAPMLRPIEYDADLMASLWRPREYVLLNPQIQAGSPCVDRTRITTSALASMAQGEDLQDVADDFDLDVAEVAAAVEYEQELSAAA